MVLQYLGRDNGKKGLEAELHLDNPKEVNYAKVSLTKDLQIK